MINPIGSVFQTFPAAYFKVLTYLADDSSEQIGQASFESNGLLYPTWEKQVGPTTHGDRRVFWVESYKGGSIVELYNSDIGTSIDGNPPADQIVIHGGDSFGDLDGGMDDLIIYRPNDLFLRKEIDGIENSFGMIWERHEDTFLVTYDSGYIESSYEGEDDGYMNQIWIYCLEPITFPESVYTGNNITPTNITPIPPLLLE